MHKRTPTILTLCILVHGSAPFRAESGDLTISLRSESYVGGLVRQTRYNRTLYCMVSMVSMNETTSYSCTIICSMEAIYMKGKTYSKCQLCYIQNHSALFSLIGKIEHCHAN